MARRSVNSRRKSEPNLGKIILLLLTLAVIAYGVNRFATWFNVDYLGAQVEASAPSEIQKARGHFAAGEREKARETLRPILARVHNAAITPQAILLMAEIELEEGNDGEALTLLKEAVSAYKESVDHPVLAARYARLLEDNGRGNEAVAIYEGVRDTAPPKLRAAALIGLGRGAERAGETQKARALYQQALDAAEWDSAAWDEALDAVGRFNVAAMFSKVETPESKKYIVKAGDSLTVIGSKLNTTQGLLTRANGIDDPSRIRLNQQLKYTPKDFRIIIERARCRLFLVDKDGIFKRYHVGLGMPGHNTNLGSYQIGEKKKDPTWYKPGAKAIPPGDPKNELGTRWMPLAPLDEDLPADLGIHGTIAPETIGKYMSHGCPRMHNNEVEELYDLVVLSTRVEIVEHIESGEFL